MQCQSFPAERGAVARRGDFPTVDLLLPLEPRCSQQITGTPIGQGDSDPLTDRVQPLVSPSLAIMDSRLHPLQPGCRHLLQAMIQQFGGSGGGCRANVETESGQVSLAIAAVEPLAPGQRPRWVRRHQQTFGHEEMPRGDRLFPDRSGHRRRRTIGGMMGHPKPRQVREVRVQERSNLWHRCCAGAMV